MPAHDIQVVTFDADGTIWDFQQTMRDELGVSLRALQHMYPDEAAELTVEEMVAHRDEAAKVFRGQPMTMEGLRFAAFVRTLDAIGVRDESLARKMAREYLERRYANATVFDDAVPALEALKDHFRLGLLTNGNSYPEKLGLGDRFSFSVVAQDHGVWKPDPAFYDLVVQSADVPAECILHIGDSVANDVRPARRAGMRAVWLNRTGEESSFVRQSYATLYSLEELPAFLGLDGR